MKVMETDGKAADYVIKTNKKTSAVQVQVTFFLKITRTYLVNYMISTSNVVAIIIIV